MITPVDLKLAGELQGYSLYRLSDASISPDQMKAAQKRAAHGCLNPNVGDPDIIGADPEDLAMAFASVDAPEMMNAPKGEQITFAECVRELHRRTLAQQERFQAAAFRMNDENAWKVGWPDGDVCHSGWPHKGFVAVKVYVDFDDYIRNNSLSRTATADDIGGAVVEGGLFPEFPNVEAARKFFVYTEETKHLAQRCGRSVGDAFIHLDVGFWAMYEGVRRTTGPFLWEQFDGFDGDHQIHIKMGPLKGYSGYAYPPDGRCEDHVTATLRNSINFSGWWFPTIGEHEVFGHSGGFPHVPGHRSDTTDSIMGYGNKPPYRSKDDHDRSLPLARNMYPNFPSPTLVQLPPPSEAPTVPDLVFSTDPRQVTNGVPWHHLPGDEKWLYSREVPNFG